MSSKNRIIALILSFFFGFLGFDRFYLGKYKTGLLKMFTLGGFCIWWFIDATLLFIDAFLYSFGKDIGFVKDKKGQNLKYGLSAYRFKNGAFRQDWFASESVNSTEQPLPTDTTLVSDSNNKKWLSRNWKWAIPVVICCMVMAIFIGVMSAMKNNEVYIHSLSVVKADSRVTDKIGENITAAFFVSGDVSNDSVNLKVPVKGEKGSADVYIVANNVAGRWKYETLTVHVDNNGIVDLLGNE